MNNRDQLLTDLRPAIDFDPVPALAFEQFQGKALRPILKLQNKVLLLALKHRFMAVKLRFESLSAEEKKSTLLTFLHKDNWLRQRLLGMVTGLFTETEFAFYLENEAEINRRIIALLLQRFTDQLV